MRFFKLVEIDEEEYIERTRDLDFDLFTQTINKASNEYPDDKDVYIAIDGTEDVIMIDMENVEDDEEWEDE